MLTFACLFLSGVGGVRRPALGPAGVDLHLQRGRRPLPPRGEPRPRTPLLRALRAATLRHAAPRHGKYSRKLYLMHFQSMNSKGEIPKHDPKLQ